MAKYVGVLREASGLTTAIEALRLLAFVGEAASDPALVGLMIASSARSREESRGSHSRTDFPNQRTPVRSFVKFEDGEVKLTTAPSLAMTGDVTR